MILHEVLKAKIARGKVTDAQLYYEGSITIDENILKAAGIREHEKVEVLNINTGARFQTYTIVGKKGSGEICLNGPAARLGYKGDPVIILSYVLVDEKTIGSTKTKFVYLDEYNKVQDTQVR